MNSILKCTQGMAVAAETLFQLVEHPPAADAVHQPYQPVQIYHCFCHLKASKLQPVDCRTIAEGPVSPTFACMPSNRGSIDGLSGAKTVIND